VQAPPQRTSTSKPLTRQVLTIRYICTSCSAHNHTTIARAGLRSAALRWQYTQVMANSRTGPWIRSSRSRSQNLPHTAQTSDFGYTEAEEGRKGPDKSETQNRQDSYKVEDALRSRRLTGSKLSQKPPGRHHVSAGETGPPNRGSTCIYSCTLHNCPKAIGTV
jgi:hypothetical protein